MAIGFGVAIPKGTPKRILKGRKTRAESKQVKAVRAAVVKRDGSCRLASKVPPVCAGASEWAHLHHAGRWKTRGMTPAMRHQTSGTVMLCALHHRLLDAHRFDLECLTDKGADGPIAVTPR